MSPVGIRTLDPKFLYLIGYNYAWLIMSTLSIDVFIISIKVCLYYYECPQADCFGEREFPGINREFKEMGPQAN